MCRGHRAPPAAQIRVLALVVVLGRLSRSLLAVPIYYPPFTVYELLPPALQTSSFRVHPFDIEMFRRGDGGRTMSEVNMASHETADGNSHVLERLNDAAHLYAAGLGQPVRLAP